MATMYGDARDAVVRIDNRDAPDRGVHSLDNFSLG